MPHFRTTSSVLRARAIKKIESKVGLREQVWKFVNSSFGLWLLSTAFISFGTWQYTQWSDGRKKELERQERRERLDQEIESRFDLLGVGLPMTGLWADITANQAASQEELLKVYDDLLSPPSAKTLLFAEYEKRGLLSLMKELSLNLDGADRECVSRALSEARELRVTHNLSQTRTYGQALKRVVRIADYRWSLEAHTANVLRQAEAPAAKASGPMAATKVTVRCGAR